MNLQIHHVGIVVEDIDRAKEVYEKAFGLNLKGRYVVKEFQAECAFLLAGNTYIELVKPLAAGGLKKFLDRHGSGTLHHICYIVDDIEAAWKDFAEDPDCWCDAVRRMTMGGLLALAFRHRLMDGEARAALMPRSIGETEASAPL